MSKQVFYGDQIYVEISNNAPPPTTDVRVLYSNGFLENSVFGVKSSNYAKTNFRGCVFTVLPSLVDPKEDLATIDSLKTELEMLKFSKPDTVGEKFLKQEIQSKQQQIFNTNETVDALNEKIKREMNNNNVCYGDLILLQHLESGYYLCADTAIHPQNPGLYNLKLKKETTSACYFKFINNSVQADRGPIDYENEAKLISAALNTVVTMGEVKIVPEANNLTPLEDEQEDPSYITFPSDSIRRDNQTRSFEGEPLAIGTTLQADNDKLRLVEYCSQSDNLEFTKKKMIKNGDYIRFELNNFYLTASKSNYDTRFGLINHQIDHYRYNTINTIFQIVNRDIDEVYPKANEVMSFSKKVEDESDIDNFYIKHFVTGTYLTLPKNQLYDTAEEEGEDVAETTAETPFFQFVNTHSKNQKLPLTRNAKISLRVFEKEGDLPTLYLDNAVASEEVVQFDINSTYFVGYKHTEDKIKKKIKQMTKTVGTNDSVGSFFKINQITQEEIRRILEFESYANLLKNFMRAVNTMAKGEESKLSLDSFETELVKMIKSTQNLIKLLKSGDKQTYILVREFKILDIINRFMYYLMAGDEVNSLIIKDGLDLKYVVDFIENLSDIILIATKGDPLTHIYVSQYVRIFINAIFSPGILFERVTESERNVLKSCVIKVLCELLWDKDLDTMGQLNYYEDTFFECLEGQKDFSVHLLRLMNHYCKSRAPNLENSLRANFITKYLTDYNRLSKTFPRLEEKPGVKGDFIIYFEREGHPSTQDLSTSSPAVEDYIKWVFILINSIAEQKSLKFFKIIREYYPQTLCEQLVDSNKVSPQIKIEILTTLRSIHLAYNQLPFDRIPSKIQIILPPAKEHAQMDIFNGIVIEAKKNLISDLEMSAIDAGSGLAKDNNHTLSELSIEILREKSQAILRGEIKSLPFTLQVMSGLLQESSNLGALSLYLIHHSLADFIIKSSKAPKGSEYAKALSFNRWKIFRVLSDIDNHVTKLAFNEAIEGVRGRILRTRTGAMHEGNQMIAQQIVAASSISVLEDELSDIVKNAMSDDWKTKEKLYQLAGKGGDAIKYLESDVVEALWRIVQNGDSALTYAAISLIKNKTSFESNLIESMFDCALFVEEKEVAAFMKLVKSLLELNRIKRKLQTIHEFELEPKEGSATVDEIIKHLEQIFLTIYDYEGHIREENPDTTTQRAEDIFLKRLHYSKSESSNELPFKQTPKYIKVFYQKVLKVMWADRILVPFIKNLTFKNGIGGVEASKLKKAVSLVFLILIVFCYKNSRNQFILSRNPDFITCYYKTEVINFSNEVLYTYVEMVKNNKKLSKLEEDYLYNVFAYSFVGYLNPFDVTRNASSSFPINYLRALPTLFDLEIPKNMFNPSVFMTKKFTSFQNYNQTYGTISLRPLVENHSSGQVPDTLRNTVKLSDEDNFDKCILINMPIYYTLLREFLKAEVSFCLTENKENVLKLQSELTLSVIQPFLSNQNIEFNFELKRIALQMLENLYFNNVYRNTNIFLDYRQFLSFTTMLFIDVYAYIRHNLGVTEDLTKLIEDPHFASQECQDYLAKYNELLKTDINKVVFLQYQSVISVKKIWKEYILYVLCNMFGHLVNNFKSFMLTGKDRGQVCKNTFDIWFTLITKVSQIDNDKATIDRINDVMKSAVVNTEYITYREKFHVLTAKSQTLNLAKAKQENHPEHGWRPDLEDLLTRHLGPKSRYKAKFSDINMMKIAKELHSSFDEDLMKKLIASIDSLETPQKDVIFILRLFRMFIESQNSNPDIIGVPIHQWKNVTQLDTKRIARTQTMLSELGLVKAVFSLLYRFDDQTIVFKEVIFLSIALLIGGNEDVQDAFYKEFEEDFDNQIIETLAHKVETSLDEVRLKETKRTRTIYFRTLKLVFENLQKVNITAWKDKEKFDIPESLQKEIQFDYSLQIRGDKELQLTEEELKSRTLLIMILKFLQSLCEGHYLNFQDFLRDQFIAEHSKSSNVPEFLRQSYHAFYKDLNAENVEIGTSILNLLIEMEQGESQPNVSLLLKKTFISDLCNTLNGFNHDLDLLSRGFGFDLNHSAFMELKSKSLIMLKDLVERATPDELTEMRQYVDIGALVSTFKQNLIAFHNTKNKEHHKIGQYAEQNMMNKEDIWNPNLNSAFTVYFILKHLSFEETMEDFNEDIKEKMEKKLYDNKGISEKLARRYMASFFHKYTGAIEIMKGESSEIRKIYFPISVLFYYLKPETKAVFDTKVDRSNTQTKIADLMESSDELIFQAYSDYNARKRVFGLNFGVLYSWIRGLSNLLCLTLTIFNLFKLVWNPDDKTVVYKDEVSIDTMRGINVVQAVLSFLLIGLWLRTKRRHHLAFKWDTYVQSNVREQGQLSTDIIDNLDILGARGIDKETAEQIFQLKGPYSEEWSYVKYIMRPKFALFNILFLCQSYEFIWHVLYFGICVGANFHPIATAFQLVDIAVRSDTVNRIATAVSRNSTQFLWTLVLLLVTIYIYSFVGFYFLHWRFVANDADLCPDAYSCFLVSLNQGLRSGGGVADFLAAPTYNPLEQGYYLSDVIYDLSFFIIVIILLLNLIFGMIIDAFGELRDEKNACEDDKKNVCFICGLKRSEYERIASFDKHVVQEHNAWHYLAYLIYLLEKNQLFATELTDVENHVLECFHKKDYSWFPVGRSLTLERKSTKSTDKKSEIQELREELTYNLEDIEELNRTLLSKLNEFLGRQETALRLQSAGNMSRAGSKLPAQPGLIRPSNYFASINPSISGSNAGAGANNNQE